jgi:4a-hydroxytetrahydrobiopterin dehydratase
MNTSAWTETEHGLHRDLSFSDFAQAFAFMTRVALLAEKFDHHPDWSNSYNRVSITLRSHDADNTVTNRDRRLAAAIDEILDE